MLKILIVEDDTIFSKQLKKDLENLNCKITGIATNVPVAVQYFDEQKPDLVLIDIKLEGQKTGIEVARHINKTNRVPFIYLSDNTGLGSPWFKAANDTKPANYLPKGFLANQLWHFIEMALYNFAQSDGIDLKDGQANCFIQNELFVKTKGNNKWQKIIADDVIYIQVNKPYCEVYAKGFVKPFLVRDSLDKTIAKFKSIQLIRLHQSHAVNVSFINKYDETNGKVHLTDSTVLEVGKTFKSILPSQILFLK